MYSISCQTFYHDLIKIWLDVKPVEKEKEIKYPDQQLIWNNVNIRCLGKRFFSKNGFKLVSLNYQPYMYDDDNEHICIQYIAILFLVPKIERKE